MENLQRLTFHLQFATLIFVEDMLIIIVYSSFAGVLTLSYTQIFLQCHMFYREMDVAGHILILSP